MMSWKRILFLAGAFLTILAVQNASAIYYIPDIGSDPSQRPATKHFDWLNYMPGYSLSASGDDITVKMRLYAPENWGPSGTNETHSGYTVGEQTHLTISWDSGVNPADATFDNVYSYFYQVTNEATSAGEVTNFLFPFSPANVIGYGTASDSGVASEVPINNIDVNSVRVKAEWDDKFSPNPLTAGSTSEWFFITSEYWWGWQDTLIDGNASSGSTQFYSSSHYSPNGQVPAPNPEAPVVALYLVGLGGVVAVFRHRRKGSEAG